MALIKVVILGLLILITNLGQGFASDYFDGATNQIRLREVKVGDSFYNSVVVEMGELIRLKNGPPEAAHSSFSFTDGVLFIPFIRVNSTLFTNASVSVRFVAEIGGTIADRALLPSGETYGQFKRAVFSAWNEKPAYIDRQRYEELLKEVSSSTTCFGFVVDDIIPPVRRLLSWGGTVYINELYPMRKPESSRRPFSQDISFPEPFSSVGTDANVYAQDDQRVVQLRAALIQRLQNIGIPAAEELAAEELKTALFDYARANALRDGLLTNWSSQVTPNTPVHFEILPLTLNLVHSFSFVANRYTPAERELVGKWLTNLVSTVLISSWGTGRQDNKAYYRSQIALAWGIVTGDSKLVRNAIHIFKHAIHEMRPDGSFINESSRGGSANLYQSSATDSIVSLAVSLEENLGLPALTFELDGKSAWTAMARVLDAVENQVKIASQYGKSCQGGSFGTVTQPDSRWGNLQSISYLRIGQKREGLKGVTERIRSINWSDTYYPEREGIELVRALGN